jgi:hypothetical protein
VYLKTFFDRSGGSREKIQQCGFSHVLAMLNACQNSMCKMEKSPLYNPMGDSNRTETEPKPKVQLLNLKQNDVWRR